MFLDVKKKRSRSMIGSIKVAPCSRGNKYGVSRVFASVALVCFATASSLVNAAAVLTFYETEGDVVAILTGDLDLTNTFRQDLGNVNFRLDKGGLINSTNSQIQNRSEESTAETQVNMAQYQITGPDSIGSGTVLVETTNVEASGTYFALVGNSNLTTPFLGLDSSYVGGTTMSGSITWDGKTFSNLGLVAGTEFVYSLVGSNDTFTVRISAGAPTISAVPLPASVLFLGAGLGGFGLMGRLRRRKLVA